MTTSRVGWCFVTAVLLISGCAESVSVRTSPPGAAVYVDDEMIGVSPVGARWPRAALSDPPKYRVQLDGYRAVEGRFRTRVSGGRIVGAAFTFGILLAFRSPRYFVPVSIALERVDVPTLKEATGSGSVEERIQKLRKLYERGLLTDQEYQRYRDEIIRGM